MPRIVIGVTTYNGAARLDELLCSIALRTPAPVPGGLDWCLVVVDDGSPRVEETRAVVAKHKNRLRAARALVALHYVEHGRNRGISAGWNTASRALDCDIVVLVNDDVIVPSGGWLEAFVHVLEHSPKVGGVGVNWHAFTDEDVPQLLAASDSDLAVVPRDPGSKKPTPERRDYEKHPPGRVMCPGGQLFAFRRADFDALGGFDEGYKSFFEESAFGTAMAAKLGKIGVQLNYPMCWHRWSATFGSSPELRAPERMAASRKRYIEQWGVPESHWGDSPGPFDYTNPKFMGAIPPVEVEYLTPSGAPRRGRLHQEGGFVDVV